MKLNKLFHGAVGVAALLVLTGANGEGCTGETDDPQPQPPPMECAPGEHLELVCDHPCDDDWYGGSTGSGDPGDPMNPGDPGDPMEPPPEPTDPGDPNDCYETCVPDDICPPDHYEELVCEGWYGDDPYGNEPGICLDPQGCEPGDPGMPYYEECYSTCVPIDQCPPGEIEEWVCVDYPEPDPQDPMDPNMPYPEDCFPVCVPIDWCGPDGVMITICDGMECWDECVYDGDPGQPPPEPDPMPEPR